MDQRNANEKQEYLTELGAEFPATGTPLNPVEKAWAFADTPAAAPVDDLAEAMQQGE